MKTLHHQNVDKCSLIGQDVDVLIGAVSQSDIELFLSGPHGPLWDAEVLVIGNPEWDLADLMVWMGQFKSKGQAKKAGRGGDIPQGFTHWSRIGRRRTNLAILKEL